MSDFKINSKVLYNGKEHTILGFDNRIFSCVIQGPSGCHYGLNREYWYDENGNPISMISNPDGNRMYVMLKDLTLIENKMKKYKLIKTYPGSGKLNSEVQDSTNDPKYLNTEFFEEVKEDVLQKAVEALGLKIGDELPDFFAVRYSQQVADSLPIESHRLTTGNLQINNPVIKEYALIKGVPCFRTPYSSSSSEVWIPLDQVKICKRADMVFVDYDYREYDTYIKIGCQKYTLEDAKAFLLTMRRAGLQSIKFMDSIDVSIQQVFYVVKLLSK